MTNASIQGGHPRSSWAAWATLALPPLLWAGNFVVGRAASQDVPPMMLACARQLIALLILLPFGWANMRRDQPRYWQLYWQLLPPAQACPRSTRRHRPAATGSRRSPHGNADARRFAATRRSPSRS
uniref:DMT family transporter n=1 Tax=Azospirillum canadense TaxID=403962 RepID=UPI002226BB9B|nr:DMT family transporter [Azospirillum canadense]